MDHSSLSPLPLAVHDRSTEGRRASVAAAGRRKSVASGATGHGVGGAPVLSERAARWLPDDVKARLSTGVETKAILDKSIDLAWQGNQINDRLKNLNKKKLR
jgi:hypothetical protein